MAKILANKTKQAAIRDYVHNNRTLKQVALQFGINNEALRKLIGNKMRPRGTRYMEDGTVKIPKKFTHSSRTQPVTPNSNRRWTKSEDEILIEAVNSQMSVEETVDLLGRTPASLYCRKSQLIKEGFISDPEIRFSVPPGLTRRKVMAHVSEAPEEIQALVSENVEVSKTLKDSYISPNAKITPQVPMNYDLSQLAQIVKEYGILITVCVTAQGTEMKLSR